MGVKSGFFALMLLCSAKTGINKSRILSEDEPRIEVLDQFLEKEEISTLSLMARDMGFHQSAEIDTPQELTFLPTSHSEFSYNSGDGDVEFRGEYKDAEREVLEQLENRTQKWMGAAKGGEGKNKQRV